MVLMRRLLDLYMPSMLFSQSVSEFGRRQLTMKLRFADLFLVLVLTAAAAGRPATTMVVAGEDSDYDDTSVNEVNKRSKFVSTHGDDTEISNRIPVMLSELSDSDIERALSADGSITGSGELKLTGEHAQSTTTSAERNVRVAPKYMLDLYNKFSTDKYSHPMANIVRSFTNTDTGRPFNRRFVRSGHCRPITTYGSIM